MVNISGVEHWFDPTRDPVAPKKRSIMLVPSAKHCRLSDMDLEKGTWLRYVKYERTRGPGERGRGTEGKGRGRGWMAVGWQVDGYIGSVDVQRMDERICGWMSGQIRGWGVAW